MSPTAILPETYAAIAAAVAGGVVVIKKLVSRKAPRDTPVTRTEFKTEMEAIRNRIGAGYLALADKIDDNHKELSSNQKELRAAIEHLSVSTEERLDRLDANFARIDERTKAL